ncbi:hypothetical protein T440DRAFT_21742 [Plenodomus tracheiphilus IPT5]|uniref:Uncharacterized protein n=1 Tax=Plenodomus tracheiphilus IPT5 TaxID=1408161 RepID=A0A6A7BC76_9PLEO|nr:hypothetical protein T440DRAFT_21742 [Plenodomus tracheiphilus IPT5]
MGEVRWPSSLVCAQLTRAAAGRGCAHGQSQQTRSGRSYEMGQIGGAEGSVLCGRACLGRGKATVLAGWLATAALGQAPDAKAMVVSCTEIRDGG